MLREGLRSEDQKGNPAPEVGCIGLLVEDTFCGPMPDLPSEGELLAVEEMPVRAGGCAANVAIDLARQGIKADVVGCVGRDAAAEVLFRTFEAAGVGSSRIVSLDRYRTSKTIVLLVEKQDRRYIHVAGANKAFTLGHIDREWLSRLRVLYLGGLFALPGVELAQLQELLRFCRQSKVVTVVDVVASREVRGMEPLKPLLPLIDIFVPNDDEAAAFTGLTDPLGQLRVFEAADANTVIITRGGSGAVACQSGKVFVCGSHPTCVIDPSGAGDAFASGVIRSILQGWELPQMLRYASTVGASATRVAGTTDSVFSAHEAEAFLAANPITVTDGR